MTTHILLKKIQFRIWSILVRKTRKYKIYPFLYISYWHSFFHKKEKKNQGKNYLSARPHPYAGIGHQMANWIAAYWFANLFDLKFAHYPFSKQAWEEFLNFGYNEISIHELTKEKAYKKIRLPLFNENNKKELDRTKKIINAYWNKKVVFICEQDQFYKNQFGVSNEIQEKFYQKEEKHKTQLTYHSDFYNIAIHIRRGDILQDLNSNPNLSMRFQNETYFLNILNKVLENIETKKEIAIYLFSQGKEEEFSSFSTYKNINICLHMNEFDSFLHMTYADLLITSKSSFSYKPALLNRGIKISPENFWHGYPQSNKWILADENGNFNVSLLKN